MTSRTCATRRTGRGFTLVELLVVMGILAVLVSLIVGVSTYVRSRSLEDDTRTRLTLIDSAMTEYYELTGNYPTEPTGGSDPTAADQLLDLPQSRDILMNLEGEAIAGSGTPGRYFVDSYGNEIIYRRTGGVGGRPVFISPGSDGDEGTPNDNVRSDE